MILILNCGSQSIKWKVFDEKLKIVAEGDRGVLDPEDFQKLLKEELAKIDRTKINLIGHRVVHGKDIFKEPLKITEENIQKLEKIFYRNWDASLWPKKLQLKWVWKWTRSII